MKNYIKKDNVSREIADLLKVSMGELKSLPCYKQLELMILGEHGYIYDPYESAYRKVELNNVAKSLLTQGMRAAGYSYEFIETMKMYIYNRYDGKIKSAQVDQDTVIVKSFGGETLELPKDQETFKSQI